MRKIYDMYVQMYKMYAQNDVIHSWMEHSEWKKY